MRLHALIFAAGQGVPLAGVVYDPKVSAFLRYIGQENFRALDTLTLGDLTAMIDSMAAAPVSAEAQAAAVKSFGRRSRSMWTPPAACFNLKKIGTDGFSLRLFRFFLILA